MPFNVLVATGLLSENRYKENEIEVFFENKQNYEKVLFFRVKPEFQEYYCLENPQTEEERKCIEKSKESNKMCDLLIYYSRKDAENDIICLVELKGNNDKCSYALEQLKSSFSKLACKTKKEYECKYRKKVTWIGCIFFNDEDLFESPYFSYMQKSLEDQNEETSPVFYKLDLFVDNPNIDKHLRRTFHEIENKQKK